MSAIANYIWETKYRHRGGDAPDDCIEDTWRRVAAAAARCEKECSRWEGAFYEELASRRLLPGGRIIAGAGTDRRVTLFNCFAAGTLYDSLDSILSALKEAALTMQQGGGIGCDFSPLRPSGTPAKGSGVMASGPVSFMQVWDTLCATLLSTSTRRGAMMATLRCDHPDIEHFVDAKRKTGTLTNFNLSVLVTDRFMQAVAADADWPLKFPFADGQTDRCIKARDLWRRIAASAHASAEPGVLFIDRINRDNNLHYCESIATTNPCGEIPLPPHGACNLGSLNLTAFVENPFSPGAALDEDALAASARIGVRFLDDVIDVSGFPLPAQAREARGTRRIGLGMTGLADALIMLGQRYDQKAARTTAERVMRLVRDTAYDSSVRLAKEKGSFPRFEKDRYLDGVFIRALPKPLRERIRLDGIRNSHVLAIAPTGTISLLADNVSSGIEPVFAFDAERRVHGADGRIETIPVRDFAYALWLARGEATASLPDAFVTAEELAADAHLEMQACLQPYVDNAISKTVNLPAEATVDDVVALYERAHRIGVKGLTIYRSGSLERPVLESRDEARCCDVVRA